MKPAFDNLQCSTDQNITVGAGMIMLSSVSFLPYLINNCVETKEVYELGNFQS